MKATFKMHTMKTCARFQLNIFIAVICVLLRHLKPAGKYFFGCRLWSYTIREYLAYSKGYAYRVCVDLSIVALQQARQRIGAHGLFVVSDVAHLPFRNDVFEGVVSLHTLHHLPLEEHQRAYRELYRVMSRGSTAVVVNGWDTPPLTRILEFPLNIRRWVRRTYRGSQN
jgi:SAM-dependent methyltransferase